MASLDRLRFHFDNTDVLRDALSSAIEDRLASRMRSIADRNRRIDAMIQAEQARRQSVPAAPAGNSLAERVEVIRPSSIIEQPAVAPVVVQRAPSPQPLPQQADLEQPVVAEPPKRGAKRKSSPPPAASTPPVDEEAALMAAASPDRRAAAETLAKLWDTRVPRAKGRKLFGQ